ncbi:MAG: class I SAM-dependent methyltransferase [Anaerolineae bacterium]|nr:class I SAM-dependent methyltransferase [Anaerolineae bacterium]
MTTSPQAQPARNGGAQAPAATAYDRTPYPGLSYSQTHPDRLATVARLLGLAPAPVAACRVLELGCANGWNLLPMAALLPDSVFLGIDNSARQITEGQGMLRESGLRNVTLSRMDISDITPSLGQFDYVIAHGVYSWVPTPVRERLLAVCSRNLAPSGVAYVSYNTYPGWHMLGIIRDMMLFHTREMADLSEKASEARALLDLLAESVPAENSAYGSFIKTYAQFLQGELKGAHEAGDALLLHDELEEVNEAFYFHEFIERAEAHDLQYLGDAEFRTMVGSNFDPAVLARMDEMSHSVIDFEQYLDFLRNRTFRQTLLCHRGLEVRRSLSPEQVYPFYVSSNAGPVEPDADIQSVSVVQFRGSDGATLSTDHPVSKAAMLCLAERWPRDVRFPDLLPLARVRLGLPPSPPEEEAAIDAQVLGANLLRAYSYSGSLVELRTHPVPLATQVAEHPLSSPVARAQARRDTRITNLRHERVKLDPIDCFLLQHLDGVHDRKALLEALVAGPVAQGALSITGDGGKPVDNRDQARALLSEGLEQRLEWFLRAGLLLA